MDAKKAEIKQEKVPADLDVMPNADEEETLTPEELAAQWEAEAPDPAGPLANLLLPWWCSHWASPAW